MNGFDNLGYFNPIILAVVALPTSLMTTKDVFTLHPSKCASTWWPLCWARFHRLLRLWLSLSQNWVHNQSSQPSTVNNCFKFIPGTCYGNFWKSTLLKFLCLAGHRLSLLRWIKLDLIFLYLSHCFLDCMTVAKIWNNICVFIIHRNCCRNRKTIGRGRKLLEIQKISTFVLSFKESQIFIIFVLMIFFKF